MALSFAVYYGLGWLKPVLGEAALGGHRWLLAGVYVALLKVGAQYPELEDDDPNAEVIELPRDPADANGRACITCCRWWC